MEGRIGEREVRGVEEGEGEGEEKKRKEKKKRRSHSFFNSFCFLSFVSLFPYYLPLHFLLRMSAPNPTDAELEARETELFRSGPLSVLTASVKSNSQVS